ncbi:hypothetical protein ACFPN2_29625 [Steroidobacter flavus]|uniref:Uncharacterized protein n=1 Tax=Steroidobacter flavus TaxID=1842136 RepID=A0ABV8T040_9GAMM
MKQKFFSRWLAIGACSLVPWAAIEPANANVTASKPVPLQQQIDRADQVAHVVIMGIESLEHVDNGPVETCGVKYRVRVIEQFKGKMDTDAAGFATRRFLLPHKKLQAGDQILVMLKNVSGIATAADIEGNPSVEQLDALSAKPGTVACQRARGNLYLTDFAENIFLIESGPASKKWLDFASGRTIIPPEIGTPKMARCEPLPAGGCVTKEPDRIEWERVREALLAGTKRNK